MATSRGRTSDGDELELHQAGKGVSVSVELGAVDLDRAPCSQVLEHARDEVVAHACLVRLRQLREQVHVGRLPAQASVNNEPWMTTRGR